MSRTASVRRLSRRPDLAEDSRYARNRDRVAHRAELDAVIGEWAAGLPLAEGRQAAAAAGLGHARLNRPSEVLSHPQLADRARWQEIGSPVGPVLALHPPPESADWDWRLDPIPALGEHTEPVLRQLGFGADVLAAAPSGNAAAASSSPLLPPPPRRYFSKSWNYDPQHRAITGHGSTERGALRGSAETPRPAAGGLRIGVGAGQSVPDSIAA